MRDRGSTGGLHHSEVQRLLHQRCEARETDGEYRFELLASAEVLDQEADRLEEIARRSNNFVERLAS